jgi:hypothetical protein
MSFYVKLNSIKPLKCFRVNTGAINVAFFPSFLDFPFETAKAVIFMYIV